MLPNDVSVATVRHMSLAKPANKLTPRDWETYPVWTFDLDNEGKPGRDETWMVPVKKLPATDIRNGGCRAKATLACGKPVTIVLRGVDLNPEQSLKLIAQYRIKPITKAERAERLKPKIPKFRIFVKGAWWDSQMNGLGDLTKALGLTIQEIFPIDYDISAFAVGVGFAVRGKIPSPLRTC
jgi:hypothetical protein